MPTSSTAKLIEKRQRRSENAEHLNFSSGGHYLRHQRPKSCRYDSYRLRARTSVVEENLFGEPLKNKLMARSKSMEVLSSNNAVAAAATEQDRLFVRRNAAPPTRPERPKTALATMRTGIDREMEFRQQQAGPRAKSQEERVQPLVLTQREFEKILMAAKVLSPSERAAQKERQMEQARVLAKESELRRESLEAAAKTYCSSSGEPAMMMPTELARELKERDHHLLERAELIREEALPEVKQLNQLIMDAKCRAIRDMQMVEKQRRLEEMAEADRHLEEEIEEERKRALAMAAMRSKQLEEFQDNYRTGLRQQKADNETSKLFEYERRQQELKARRELEAAQRDAEAAEREKKKRIAAEMKLQMQEELREINFRKELEAEARRRDEERTLALQNERRQAEIAREQEDLAKKKATEEEKLRILGQIEQDAQIKDRREEIRMLRQQEAKDRAWREKELHAAQDRALQEQEIRDIRTEQLRQKRENAARSVQREREYWVNYQQEWQDIIHKESDQAMKKKQKRRDYLQDLQAQMESNKAKAMTTVQSNCGGGSSEFKQQYQDRLDKIRERKLQQLRAYNVPEKYLKEIEKKCQNMAKTRFTLSYFGKK